MNNVARTYVNSCNQRMARSLDRAKKNKDNPKLRSMFLKLYFSIKRDKEEYLAYYFRKAAFYAKHPEFAK